MNRLVVPEAAVEATNGPDQSRTGFTAGVDAGQGKALQRRPMDSTRAARSGPRQAGDPAGARRRLAADQGEDAGPCLNGCKAIHASAFRPLAVDLRRRRRGHGVARQRSGARRPSGRPVGGPARVSFTSITDVSTIAQGLRHSRPTPTRHADRAQGRIDAPLRRVVH